MGSTHGIHRVSSSRDPLVEPVETADPLVEPVDPLVESVDPLVEPVETSSARRTSRPVGTKRGLVGGLVVLLATLMLIPAGAAEAAPRPIRKDFFGVQDDFHRNASPSYGASRLWAAWCTIQPGPRGNPKKGAERVLGRAFKVNAKAGRSRVTVSLGHPPPWVYGNHRNALKRAGVWYCKGKRSTIAFPSAKSLRAGTPTRKAYAAYVTGVIVAAKPYLAKHKANRLVLQAWNEPNLGSGGKINTKIPGTAKTWRQAADSLREQERIIRFIAGRLIPGRFEITTPSMYGKPTKLGTPYFRAQARDRTVDSVSLNFYTLYVKTPNSSIKKWRSKAASAKRVVTKYKGLRSVPIWITETNHNLVNSGKQTNRTPTWRSPAAQRRLMEVTTLEAIRLGFAGIEWYQGSLSQTAVNNRAGTAATVANTRVRDLLVGRVPTRCKAGKKTSWCQFSARKGSPAIRVSWSAKGTAGIVVSR